MSNRTKPLKKRLSPSRVDKIMSFKGGLPPRPLYVYLPPGYDDQPSRYYPVLYMHDGQNCFQRYVRDSYAGSWRADEVADRLIAAGRMRPCVIVAVSHGEMDRLSEYLPPYTTFQPPAPADGKKKVSPPKPIVGRADLTARYYIRDVAPYIRKHYRVKTSRTNTATCGSSMGGLFSTYLAWEYPQFARHHAALSASFWITEEDDGRLAIAEQLRTERPRDIRLWLDSGTEDSPGKGDDNSPGVITVRDALLDNGYKDGRQIRYFLDEGAIHSENAWHRRLDMVFPFLFPPRPRRK